MENAEEETWGRRERDEVEVLQALKAAVNEILSKT
jgi:hypothetical protein